jgi:transposase
VRALDTGHGRKTDPVDAHSVAVAGLRSPGLRQVLVDDATVALRLLVDRRDELGRARSEVVSRIHQLLLELIPGGAKKFLTRGQASYLLRTAPEPVDIVAQTRQQLARELIEELTVIDAKIRAADKQLRQLVAMTGSSLEKLNGIGPSGAARLLGDIGDISRFRSAAHFASWNGTAPIEASSGDQKRHRLSRAGNRRINRVLHIMAVVQLRHETPGRAYYRRRVTEGKSPMEAMRALKRHLSDVVYRQMVLDARTSQAGPGGHVGATLQSSAASPIPTASSSDKSQPGPAASKRRTALAAKP